jgi:hypothetical protein
MTLSNKYCHVVYLVTSSDDRQGNWHVCGEEKNLCRVLAGRPEGERQLGRSRRKCEDNIKGNLRKILRERGDWINMAPDGAKCRVFVNMITEFQVP